MKKSVAGHKICPLKNCIKEKCKGFVEASSYMTPDIGYRTGDDGKQHWCYGDVSHYVSAHCSLFGELL